jgi:uncharacterized protein (TIGR02099 family)
MTTYARKLIKWFYFLFALAAISVAVVVQAGRSFSHLLADYPQELSAYLSDKLNAKVSIETISAEWVGLKPMVDIHNLSIRSQTDKSIIAVGHAQMRLDLLGTFAHARLVWSALQLDQVQMDFVQLDNGFWQIPGVPQMPDKSKDDQQAQLDFLIDMSLLSRRIEFSRSELSFHFASGATSTLSSPLLRMENAGDFHRLSLQIDVDGRPKSLTVLAEGQGDPRRKANFSSKAFIQLNQFPTNEPIAATTAFLLRGIKAEVHGEGALDASLWLSSRPHYEGVDVVGKLGIQRLSVPMLGHALSLNNFSTDVIGHWLYTGEWQLALQQIGAKVNQYTVENLSFAASAASFSEPVILHLPSVNLQRLNKTLDNAGVLGEGHLRDLMRQLDPEGELRNLQVAIPTQNPREWELQANLTKVGVNAWHGVPALRKVDGFVHATQQGGFVDVDSREGFSMHYSPTYSAPMEYQQVKGQVAWWLQPENNQIYVNSGALEFANGDEQAKGYMWLALPWHPNTGDVDLYLQIGAKQLGASLYRKYTPAVVPQSLTDWLAKSIGPNNAGFADQVGFVYRGTLNNHNHAARSHQLFVDIKRAQLNYHPEWPALDSIDGRLLVSDEDVSASVDKAKLFNSDVGVTQINVNPNPDGHGALLRVNGSVIGGASDGLRVLRESMLRRYIGANMDTWKLDGNMRTQLNIAVPLDHEGTGAAQQVDIELESPSFEMGNLKLAMQNISGHLNFKDTTGLSSEGLNATLFGEPIKALLSTKRQGDSSQTLVDVKGEVDSQALAKWTQRPEVLFVQGRIPYNALVELNHTTTASDSASTSPFAVVTVTSPLSGVSVDLPAPYGKVAEGERFFRFKMSLFERSSLVDMLYGDNLQALFELDPHQDNKLLNANIALNDNAKLAAEPQFLLSGNLPSLDIEPWKKLQQRYIDYGLLIDSSKPKSASLQDDSDSHSALTNADENSVLVAGLPFRADMLLKHYQVGPLSLDDINVRAERLISAWKIAFTNPLVDGDVRLPNDASKPLSINLEILHLNSALLGAKPTEMPVAGQLPKLPEINLDPRTLPLADVTVKALYMDDVNYGNWSLQIRPNTQGVLFENINGSVKGVTVSGLSTIGADGKIISKAKGAKLNWLVSDTGSSTHFIGELSAGDMSAVLREWQKPDTLESKSARFNLDLTWGGDPQDFALTKIAGNVDLMIEHGRFKNNPSPGSDGFLRLMAVLNFDSLARRLRLDFSDLYKSGLAYDQISGKVSFAPGTMTFVEPLEVKTPSSRLQMAGKLDLENEKIDARLVATLPVVGSYTFFTALVTGLPAAAGIYVVSKLFKKQVDRATSISYSLSGNWSDPKMSFDRLFESEEELIKSVDKKEESPVKGRRRKIKTPTP